MARMGRQHRKNVKKRQTDMQSPYGKFGETTKSLCLKCGEKFGSISKFNKLCEPCNQENEVIKESVNSFSNSSITVRNHYTADIDYDGAYGGD
jgi:hypothetical protein